MNPGPPEPQTRIERGGGSVKDRQRGAERPLLLHQVAHQRGAEAPSAGRRIDGHEGDAADRHRTTAEPLFKIEIRGERYRSPLIRTNEPKGRGREQREITTEHGGVDAEAATDQALDRRPIPHASGQALQAADSDRHGAFSASGRRKVDVLSFTRLIDKPAIRHGTNRVSSYPSWRGNRAATLR